MQKYIEQQQEVVQSAISYGGGTGLIGMGWLVDVASSAQALALILGCLVIAVRLVHDFIALVRFIKNKPKK